MTVKNLIPIEHTHLRDDAPYVHSHSRGDVPHGHHGSRYAECNVARIARPKEKLPVVGVRPVVSAFATEMERVLKVHDHKGGWSKDDCSIEYLQARLVEELGEYFRSVAIHIDYQTSYGKQIPIASKELVDIANFAMMLWDRHAVDNAPFCGDDGPEVN